MLAKDYGMGFHTMSGCSHRSQKIGSLNSVVFYSFLGSGFLILSWTGGMQTRRNEGKAPCIAILILQCSFMPNMHSQCNDLKQLGLWDDQLFSLSQLEASFSIPASDDI